YWRLESRTHPGLPGPNTPTESVPLRYSNHFFSSTNDRKSKKSLRLAIRRFGWNLLWPADLRFFIHTEQDVVRQCVLGMVSLAQKAEIHFRALWQPQLLLYLFEVDRSVVNRQVLFRQLQFLYWLAQVCLKTNDVERIRGNPNSALKRNGKGFA